MKMSCESVMKVVKASKVSQYVIEYVIEKVTTNNKPIPPDPPWEARK
jgi:hypothetical protein